MGNTINSNFTIGIMCVYFRKLVKKKDVPHLSKFFNEVVFCESIQTIDLEEINRVMMRMFREYNSILSFQNHHFWMLTGHLEYCQYFETHNATIVVRGSRSKECLDKFLSPISKRMEMLKLPDADKLHFFETMFGELINDSYTNFSKFLVSLDKLVSDILGFDLILYAEIQLLYDKFITEPHVPVEEQQALVLYEPKPRVIVNPLLVRFPQINRTFPNISPGVLELLRKQVLG